MLVERTVRAKRGGSSPGPLAAEAAHRGLPREHAELERRLSIAVRRLGALAEGMDGDGVAEDRGQAAFPRDVERVLEQPAEDTEAPVGGMDDCGAGLSGWDTGDRHQRVMPDDQPVVDGNRRQQLARSE